jgi:hypothetical protein
MDYSANKRQFARPVIMRPIQQELEKAPRQFNDYMDAQCTRFNEICRLYLDGLTLDDVRYMKPEDLINLVPKTQYRHRLLMTIMVRRYLYRPAECETVYCRDGKSDKFENYDSVSDYPTDTESRDSQKTPVQKVEKKVFSCNKCIHVCSNADCKHDCSEYAKIDTR